ELDQVCGGNYVDPETSHQLHCSRIHQAHVRNIIQGRILHGDSLLSVQDLFQLLALLYPRRIEVPGSRQSVEIRAFDAVDELGWLTLSGNQVIPAARAHDRSDLENAVSDGIAMVM